MNLQQIKQTLDRIELKLSFQHAWFPHGKFVSFWNFYNKVNTVQEQVTEHSNSKKFYARIAIPLIP